MHPVGAINQARILAALETPMTRYELAEALHLHVRTIQEHLTRMMRERMIRVVHWHLNSRGTFTPYYKAGRGRRTPRPVREARTSNERRIDQMRNPQTRKELLERRKERYRKQQNAKAVTMLASALFAQPIGRTKP